MREDFLRVGIDICARSAGWRNTLRRSFLHVGNGENIGLLKKKKEVPSE